MSESARFSSYLQIHEDRFSYALAHFYQYERS